MRRRIKVEERNRKRIRWKHFMTKVDESEREGRTGKKGSRGRKKQVKEKQKKINTQKKYASRMGTGDVEEEEEKEEDQEEERKRRYGR